MPARLLTSDSCHVQYSANISLSQNGLTALHLAAQDDHVPVAQALIDARAELDPSTKVLSPSLSSFALLSNE